MTATVMKSIVRLLPLGLVLAGFLCTFPPVSAAEPTLPTPVDVWSAYDPDAGDFKEEIISEGVNGGIYRRESYISAYVNGEEVRVYCKYAVKEGARKAPALMDVHGWMASPRIDESYVQDGWAVMAHDYCGKSGNREQFTRYPEALRHGNMDGKVGVRIKSKLPDGQLITDPNQTDDYLYYAIQRRVLSYLLAQEEVDPERVGARGYSYGGTLMWNLGMDPRVDAVVAYFGIGFLEYYRSRNVWMYQVPKAEPLKTAGEELYLAAIAPQAHVPHMRAATLWLNGTNDHHGGHERSLGTFANFQEDVPWDFALQARGHHNTDLIKQNEKLWLEKHVLGEEVYWPERPVSELRLDADGVPELYITPADPAKVEKVEAWYALKNPISFARLWRDCVAVRQGDAWVAKLPVIDVDDYVFGFGNISYDNSIVVSTAFEAAIPSQLGAAVATDEPSDTLPEGVGMWQQVGPAEGPGGVKAFRPVDNRRGASNGQFSDPKFRAPEGAELAFRFYCTQPQTIQLKAGHHFVAELEIPASNDWQEMSVPAGKLRFVHPPNHEPLKSWSEMEVLTILPKEGSDLTKIIFADFRWRKPGGEGR